jgi:ribosomal-protein-serine acetyltransferase
MTAPMVKLERPQLFTRRLLLRPLRPRHAETVFDAIDESRRTLRKWMPWVDATETPDDTLAFIRRMGRRPGDIVWGIWERDVRLRPGRLRYCGGVGLHRVVLSQGTAMLGYWTRRTCEGCGYATEASAAVLLWAFGKLGLERVEIAGATGNAGSLRVIEKLGFVREGIMRAAQRIPNKRRRLDWMFASLICSDLPKVRRQLTEHCGTRKSWEP